MNAVESAVESAVEETAKTAVGVTVAPVAGSALPWIILVVVALFIGSCGFAYYEGVKHQKNADAAAALKVQQEWDAKVAAERARGDQLAAALEAEKQNIKTQTVTVIKEVPKVTTIYREAPNAPLLPIPDAVYTAGWLRLYNAALVGPVPAAASGSPRSSAGADDLARARIESADILGNAVENFGKYAECRAQLNKLIDFEMGKSPAK